VPTFDLVLVGFGNVGRRFVRLLEERRAELNGRYDLDWRVIGIATARHGAAFSLDGLDVARAAAQVESGASLDALASGARAASGVDFIEQCVHAAHEALHPTVVVETTILDVRAGQPATDHVRTALRNGAHVVTANKGPVAFAYAEIDELARSAGLSFLFEGAVMDGIPIFNLARSTLPAVRIAGLRGVVNSTTNYILTAMESGRELADSLAEMQAAGIAEADASLDIDGWDAAAKTAALANVLMGGRLTPHTVSRTGIGGLTAGDVRGAVARRQRIKLVSRVERRGDVVVARVGPEALPEHDLLATLRDQQNALVLETALLGDFSIVQLGGGLTQTAYALVSDLVELGRRVSSTASTATQGTRQPAAPGSESRSLI
jgi:homoserine dehydrogenase